MTHPPATPPEWLTAELGPTVRLASALTDGPDAAADLVADSLARDRPWLGLDPSADPSTALRAAIMVEFLSRRRPPAKPPDHAGVRPDPLRPDPSGPDPEALDALPPRTRAAVVLRDSEHLTTAEIATLLDRPAKQVAAILDPVPPGAHDLEIGDRTVVAPPLSAVVSRYGVSAARLGGERRRRRTLVGLALTMGAAVAIGLIMLPTIVNRLDPPTMREPGEWRFTHVVASPSWPVRQRILTVEREYTMVAASDGSTCVVSLGRGSLTDEATSGRPVRVGTRTGYYSDDASKGPGIVWEYAPEAHAEARCFDQVADETLRDLAGSVEFVDSRVRLPFLISSLPRGFQVATIDERRAGAEVAVTLQPEEELAVPSVTISFDGDQPVDRCVEQRDGHQVCLATSWSAEDAPNAPGRARLAVDAVVDRLELAPDLNDRSTWFDATDLPR